MKKLTLTLCAVSVLASAAFAGTSTYSGKEMKQVEQAPCPTWYADNEFNVTISGVYAATVNKHDDDTYLGDDHSWGGAIDAKYFFRRYFGLGIQGFGVDTDNTHRDPQGFRRDSSGFVGGVLGTFTFRYPIPCTRFAPYAWIGGGVIFDGGSNGRSRDFDVDNTDDLFNNGNSGDARLMAQYGAGFEVRFTPHVGLMNDVSYNHLEGGENDFIQFRSGLNFAF
ncbi:MAG: hypothetical protein ABI883_01975 [Chthoniobacterales bacterium]